MRFSAAILVLAGVQVTLYVCHASSTGADPGIARFYISLLQHDIPLTHMLGELCCFVNSDTFRPGDRPPLHQVRGCLSVRSVQVQVFSFHPPSRRLYVYSVSLYLATSFDGMIFPYYLVWLFSELIASHIIGSPPIGHVAGALYFSHCSFQLQLIIVVC
jgi:hypothetical protein